MVSSFPGTALPTASSAFLSRPWQLEARPRAGGKDEASLWPSSPRALWAPYSSTIISNNPGICGWYSVLNVSANRGGSKAKPCWLPRLRAALEIMQGVLLLSAGVLVESLYAFSPPKDCWVNRAWLLLGAAGNGHGATSGFQSSFLSSTLPCGL